MKFNSQLTKRLQLRKVGHGRCPALLLFRLRLDYSRLAIPLLIHIFNCLHARSDQAFWLPLAKNRLAVFCLHSSVVVVAATSVALPSRRKRRPQTKRLIESKLSRKVLGTIDWMCSEQKEHRIWGFDALFFLFIALSFSFLGFVSSSSHGLPLAASRPQQAANWAPAKTSNRVWLHSNWQCVYVLRRSTPDTTSLALNIW